MKKKSTKRIMRKWANTIVDSELAYLGRRYWLKDGENFVTYENNSYFVNNTPVSRTVARDTILHCYYGASYVKRSFFRKKIKNCCMF